MITKILFAGLCIATIFSSCTGTRTTKGIVTNVGDTMSFILPTSIDQSGEIRPGDTLEIKHSGKYRHCIEAEGVTLYSKQLVGADRDSHGCIGSAGYIWCEVQKNCIRLWEEGKRMESTDGSNHQAYVVFAPDSMQVEIFFSDGSDSEILQRRTLPSGIHVWNMEDDDTKSLRCEADGQWIISQRTSILFRSSIE